MKNIKFAVLACGVLGLVGCFLPMVSAEGMSFSFWDAHKAPDGVQVYLVMAGFALAAVMAGVGAAKGFKRQQAIGAIVGFAFVIFKFRGMYGDMLKGAIGAKLMVLAALAGAVISVVAAAKPEDAQ